MSLFFLDRRLMDKAEDGKGGGGAGGKDTKGSDAPDYAKDIADLKSQNAALMARLDKMSTKADDKKDDNATDDLNEKARKQAEEKSKKSSDTRALESALKFSIESESFYKKNESFLPNDVKDIFAIAEKENYEDAIQKSAAIKSGIIQSFFKVQSNLDLLTPSLRLHLDDYLKLTKDGKQDNAQSIYDSVFEPAFEMLKRVKKAEALQKGLGDGSTDAYKNKLIGLSKKHYLGEKSQ